MDSSAAPFSSPPRGAILCFLGRLERRGSDSGATVWRAQKKGDEIQETGETI